MQNNIIGKKSIHSLALMESFQRAMIEGIKGFCFRKSFKANVLCSDVSDARFSI